MNWETAILLIGSLGGLELIKYLVNLFVNHKNNQRKNDAEADKAEAEVNKEEVSRLLSQIDHQQKTTEELLTLNASLSERLSKLNATVDKHIDRNRELSDRLFNSETELNRANERIIKLTEERDTERILKEHYKLWHCRKADCFDRIPPNKKLKGLKYEHPKKSGSASTNHH